MQFPVTIPIGPWDLHPHPVFEVLGYALGFQLFLALRRRNGDVLATGQRPLVVLAAIAGAIMGSKILAWLIDPAATWTQRADVQTWFAGKTIVGGLLGGLIAVEGTKRVLGITQSTGDLYALPLCIGIAVGRVGCLLTGLADRTHGTATSLPWGIDFGDGIARHPTQIYEMLFLIGLASLLLVQQRRPHEPGDQFRLFMVGYLAWRFVVGFIQPAPEFLGLAAIQWACAAGLVYYARHVPRLVAFRSPTHA